MPTSHLDSTVMTIVGLKEHTCFYWALIRCVPLANTHVVRTCIHVYTITDERVTCRLRFRDTVSGRTDTTAHRRDALSAGNRDTGIR